MLYPLLRPALFALEPERAHALTLRALAAANALGAVRALFPPPADLPVRVMGLTFPNPVGLAAGMDKNGECIDAFGALGFGFIEIGTVTPRPQPGNPRPRLFRIPQARAVINRMGFNNDGLEQVLANVRRSRYRGILGINIGKNFDTPIERAADDYLAGLRAAYPHAGYVAVNISSPNTANLRQLQQADELDALLAALTAQHQQLADQHGRHVPLAVKIAPDLDHDQIAAVAGLLKQHRIDGVIATNTTLSRTGVEDCPASREAGGLSGALLGARSTEVIRQLAQHLQGSIPIIGVGGIMSGEDARRKLAAGASLVQVYTGLIYRGPGLVKEIVEALGAQAAAP